MGMKDVFKRYLVFVIGLYFLAAGIVLIVRSAWDFHFMAVCV